MYNFTQINDTNEPIRLAATIPHHIPFRFNAIIQQNIDAKIGVNITVLRRVALNAYTPFPVP